MHLTWFILYKTLNVPDSLSFVGHFTQVVWKSSEEVGVGLATDGNTVFVVGQYKPAGNISSPGYFKDNVLPVGNHETPFILLYLFFHY